LKTEYFAPADIETVLEVLGKNPDDAVLMAGGTALLWAVRILGKAMVPRTVISLQNLKGALGAVKQGADTEMGALVSLAVLAGEAPGGMGVPPALAQSCRSVGYPGIRRTATLGGNLANGVMPPQLLPALAVLGAGVHVRSRSESRKVDLGTSVSDDTYYPIVGPGELIISVTIPSENAQALQAYVDFSWPGKDPVAVASAFYRDRLRVSLLADQKLSLWTGEMGAWSKDHPAEAAEAAFQKFGLGSSSFLSPIDVYRRRALIVRSLDLMAQGSPR